MKREFNPAITESVKTAANGSFADNVKMLDVAKLKPHENNFYSMSDIELLAEDVERQGIKSNLVVREGENGEYIIISGHRRHKAYSLLLGQGRVKSRLLPCYVNPAKSDDNELLDLIMLNATTRKLTDGEMLEQFEKLTEIFKAQKAGGENVRIRDEIAKTLGVSTGQVAKMEAINKKATAEVKEAVKAGEMSLSTANEVAKLSEDEQTELLNNKPVAEIKNKEVKAKSAPKEKPLPQMTTEDVPEALSQMTTEDEPEVLSQMTTKNDFKSFPMFSTDVVKAFNKLDLSKFGISSQGKENLLGMLLEKIYEIHINRRN